MGERPAQTRLKLTGKSAPSRHVTSQFTAGLPESFKVNDSAGRWMCQGIFVLLVQKIVCAEAFSSSLDPRREAELNGCEVIRRGG